MNAKLLQQKVRKEYTFGTKIQQKKKNGYQYSRIKYKQHNTSGNNAHILEISTLNTNNKTEVQFLIP